MIKLSFWLKKPNAEQSSLEYIKIDSPKIDKTKKFDWGYRYACEVYISDMGKTIPYYGINPVDTLFGASEFVKIHCQSLLKSGCSISEIESKDPWKLEKLNDNYLQKKINELKNNPNISQNDKDKILGIIKETFGKPPSPIKDQINILINEKDVTK